MNISFIFGSIGASLIFAWLALRLVSFFSKSFSYRIAIWLMALITAPIYFKNFSITSYIYGLLGCLSPITLVLILFDSYQLIFTKKPPKCSVSFYFVIFFSSLLLYLSALGVSMIDVYSWGYSFSIFIAIGVFASILFYFGDTNAFLILNLSLLWDFFCLSNSTNSWDSFTDPILFIYSFYTILTFLRKKYHEFI